MSNDVEIPSTPTHTRTSSKTPGNDLSAKRKRKRAVEADDVRSSGKESSSKKQKRKPNTLDDPVISSQVKTVKDSQDVVSDSTDDSPFITQTTSFYLPLSPVAQTSALEGLCAEHISPLILTYYPPLKGVLLSYTNARLSNEPTSKQTADDEPVLAKSFHEYAVSFVWLTADFLIFQPRRNILLEGYVNVQNASHIGLVCYNLFNASVDARRLPLHWKFSGPSLSKSKKQSDATAVEHTDDDVGSWLNDDGEKIEGSIKFRVHSFETLPASGGSNRGFFSLEGSLLSEDEEKQKAEEAKRKEAKKKSKTKATSKPMIEFDRDGDY